MVSTVGSGGRIEWLQWRLELSEAEARERVAYEYPCECGACGSAEVGATSCEQVLDVAAGGATCRQHIDSLVLEAGMEEGAARAQVATSWPTPCRPCGPACAPARCDVHAGRSKCGGSQWLHRAGSRSEMVTISTWAARSVYSVYATFEPRRCDGYGLPSSPSLPGGGPVVDCVGNCATGAGYCYASSDGALCRSANTGRMDRGRVE